MFEFPRDSYLAFSKDRHGSHHHKDPSQEIINEDEAAEDDTKDATRPDADDPDAQATEE